MSGERSSLPYDFVRLATDSQRPQSLEWDISELRTHAAATDKLSSLSPRGIGLRNKFRNRHKRMGRGIKTLPLARHVLTDTRTGHHTADDSGLCAFLERDREKLALAVPDELYSFRFRDCDFF